MMPNPFTSQDWETRRLLRIARMTAENKSSLEIAQELDISERTVRRARRRWAIILCRWCNECDNLNAGFIK